MIVTGDTVETTAAIIEFGEGISIQEKTRGKVIAIGVDAVTHKPMFVIQFGIQLCGCFLEEIRAVETSMVKDEWV